MRYLYPSKLKNRLFGGAKATTIDDRKRTRIRLIQVRLRSSILGSFRASRKADFSVYLGLLCLFVLFACAGCQNPRSKLDEWVEPSDKIKVLSTTAIIDDIVSQIGKDRIDHLALIEGAMDPHSYEIVKGDAEKLSYAQVIFYNGLGLEHGASLRHQLKQHPKAVALGDKIREKNPGLILFEKGQVDPHIWLDISLWAEIIDPIVQALSEVDPKNSDYYQANGQLVRENLLSLDASLSQKLQMISQEKRFLVTSHDAFNYFTRRYLHEGTDWKDRFCAPEGLAPDGQLSCHDIQKVINYLIQHRVKVIFPESNVSKDSLKKILSVCKEKGIAVQIASSSLDSDTLGTSGNYQSMMEHNVNVLYEAWK
jgi:manganese/zinc/iron transport system substrate-binding protein